MSLAKRECMKNPFSGHSNLDRLGIFISSLCIVHCLLLPIFILSLPIMARYYLAHPWFHVVIAVLVIPVGLFAFIRGFRHHRKKIVVGLGIPGLLIVAFGPLLVHTLFNKWNEAAILLVGSALLIAAHILNRRECKTCPH